MKKQKISLLAAILGAAIYLVLSIYWPQKITTLGFSYHVNLAVGSLCAFAFWFLTTLLYLRSQQIYGKILVGMVGGAIFGGFYGSFCSLSISPLGDIFIRLIKMIVVPLVFASLSLGVLSLGDIKKIGKIGGKTICYYLITTSLAISIGLVLANLIQPGTYINKKDKQRYLQQYQKTAQAKISSNSGKALAIKLGKTIAESQKFSSPKEKEAFIANYAKNAEKNFIQSKSKQVSMRETFVRVVPTNPIEAMAKGNMLQIIFIALLFGLVLATISADKRAIIEKGLSGVNDAMITLVNWIMLFAPFGVFALMAKTISQAGTSILQALFVYMIVVLLGLITHITLVYSTVVRIFSGISLWDFLYRARSVLLLAFSTSSSAATLPVTMRCAEDEFKVSRSISSFVLPLGATINMDGTALYQGVAAVFIAQVFGIQLDFSGQLTILLTATLASIGTAAVPGAGMIILAMVLESIGVPLTGIALIIGVDRILDMCRTAVNVTGDLSATIFIQATESRKERNGQKEG